MNKERIQFLLNNLAESLNVEVKNWLNALSDNNSKSKLAKEIIALANHGGGYIFIGFNDDNSHTEIIPSSEELEAFSQDAIANIVEKYIEPQVQCEIG